MVLLPPRAAERYRDLVVVGQGSMGAVLRARDAKLKRTVAIKVIRQERRGEDVQRRRFLREARILAGLSHPNLVRLYDADEEDDTVYLVMEYVEGAALHALSRDGVLTVPEVVGTVAAVADALKAAHDEGVLHRDVKPGNILVDLQGVAKLADFGLARTEGLDETALTQHGFIVGTLGYIAPEILRGEPASVSSDVYGLGVTFYEALTHRPAVSHEAFEQMLRGRPPLPLPRPSATVPGADETLDRLVLSAMAFDAAERTPSAATLRDACEDWLAGHGRRIGPSSVTVGKVRAASVLLPPPRPSPSPWLRLGLACILTTVFLTALTLALPRRDSGPLILEPRLRCSALELSLAWRTQTPRRLSMTLVDETSGSVLLRMDESEPRHDHVLDAVGLRPASPYRLEIRDDEASGSIHALTRPAALASPPRVWLVGGVLALAASSTTSDALTLEATGPDDSVPRTATATSGAMPLLVGGLAPAATVSWLLRLGSAELARGEASPNGFIDPGPGARPRPPQEACVLPDGRSLRPVDGPPPSLLLVGPDGVTPGASWPLPLPAPGTPLAQDRRLILRDFGRLAVVTRGSGYLAPPLLTPAGVLCVVGARVETPSPRVLASFIVVDPNAPGTATRVLVTTETAAVPVLPVLQADGDVLAAAGPALLRLSPLRGTATTEARLPAPSPGAPSPYLTGPPLAAGPRVLLLAVTPRERGAAFRALMPSTAVRLASLEAEAGLHLHEPPLFFETPGDLQDPGVVAAWLHRDRWLVGATRHTLFAVDLVEGTAGSHRVPSSFIREATLDDGGLLRAGLDAGPRMEVPVQLLARLSQVTLTTPRRSP